MPDTSVKRIHESMRGAPVLNGVAGSLIGLLDTFLVNGWGMATANSLSVSSGVATLTMPAGSEFEDHCVVLVAGATPAALNGEQRIATTNGTTLTFPTTAANGPATGTITVKYAACGWQKVFSGANLAVYRSQNVMGNRRFLRVQDTGNVDARIVAYNNMTAVSTGTGPFPTAAQVSGGGYWNKSMTADATAQRYDLFSDDRMVYFGSAAAYVPYGSVDSSAAAVFRPFGDPVLLKQTGDAWGSVMAVAKSSGAADTAGGIVPGGIPGLFVERALAGTGTAIESAARPDAGSPTAWPGEDAEGFGSFPGAVDGRLRLSRIRLSVSATDVTARGYFPGFFYVPHTGLTSHATLKSRDTVDGFGALSGRKLMLMWVGAGARQGAVFVDITGPWR